MGEYFREQILWRLEMRRLRSDQRSKIFNIEVVTLVIILLLLMVLFAIALIPGANAYYGLSGFGLYGGGLYGGLGLYGLGGLYGMGLYGLGGGYGGIGGLYSLYGLGSLYGFYGLGGIGGLYGLSGIYGLSGLYGLGSLYGLGGLYGGLGGFGGLLGTMNQLSNLGLLNTNTQNPTQTAPVVTAEQTGFWTGAWFSLIQLKGGLMNMTLIENTLTGILSGEVNLILNKITNSVPASVTGFLPVGVTVGTGTTFVLSGGNQGFLGTSLTTLLLLPTKIPVYNIELRCTMTSPVTMSGTYQILDLDKLEIDYGNFDLTLTTPVI